MKLTLKNKPILLVFTIVFCVVLLGMYRFYRHKHTQDLVLNSLLKDTERRYLTITYPKNNTIFPPEIIAPSFRWVDAQNSDAWVVKICFHDKTSLFEFSGASEWKPDAPLWAKIKERCIEKSARIVFAGYKHRSPGEILSRDEISIRTSRDQVGAPIFYRDVNLPFIDAVKDPSQIKWRIGYISSEQEPQVVLENLPVCGNCHSFDRDAKFLAMDVDYANDKGSYIITRVAEEMRLATGDVITWENFGREQTRNLQPFQRDISTFGLLSQISPDGKYVVSTVKDQSVFVDTPDLAFSQLFFPVKGILAVYSRLEKTFTALSGADDPHFVQSNPTWSPDGQYIVFAKRQMYRFKNRIKGKVLLTQKECEDFLKHGKLFAYDLYRIPFNNGKGGKAEPLAGASNNGKSNFFARYSPDGKWIVFCQAKSYMLLQPDSKLYILPAQGGQARELSCNTECMNSWHSWSPNSKWLVFSSKAISPYTQLFLTHIDENGFSSPPVLLEQFVHKNRAVNIPEFMNTTVKMNHINQQFVDDYSWVRKGELSALYGDYDDAIAAFRQALLINTDSYWSHAGLGYLLHDKGRFGEAIFHYKKAYALEQGNTNINKELGFLLSRQHQYRESIFYLFEALKHSNDGAGLDESDHAMIRFYLGYALLEDGQVGKAIQHLKTAVDLEPKNAQYQYFLTISYALSGEIQDMYLHLKIALSLDPEINKSPVVLACMAKDQAAKGDYKSAVTSTEQALQLATKSGNKSLVVKIQRELEFYQEKWKEQLRPF
ncbi:PD40 domain-containing protein [candidate division KSB1 bacterium]|nr:PD40 domain-containing protein [candidate division KSB1 bacterium]